MRPSRSRDGVRGGRGHRRRPRHGARAARALRRGSSLAAAAGGRRPAGAPALARAQARRTPQRQCGDPRAHGTGAVSARVVPLLPVVGLALAALLDAGAVRLLLTTAPGSPSSPSPRVLDLAGLLAIRAIARGMAERGARGSPRSSLSQRSVRGRVSSSASAFLAACAVTWRLGAFHRAWLELSVGRARPARDPEARRDREARSGRGPWSPPCRTRSICSPRAWKAARRWIGAAPPMSRRTSN